MTRNEAVEWLNSVGVKATVRDWDLGQTIAISIGKPVFLRGLMDYSKGTLYICPQENGQWSLRDCTRLIDRSCLDGFDLQRRYPNLESATQAAREFVAKVEKA